MRSLSSSIDLDTATKPLTFMVAVGAALATVWAALTYIPRVIRMAKRVYDKLERISQVDGKLDMLLEAQHQAAQMRRVQLDADTTHVFFESDARGHMIWASRQWHLLTGLNEMECRGRGWENGISDETRDKFVVDWQKAVDHQRNFEGTVEYVDRRGRTSEAHLFVSVMSSPASKAVTGFFGVGEILNKPVPGGE